ncbi:MAG: FAD-dependent oxidoreductase [Sphaerochaetaceae bacterium]|jgi:hypothetical protein|nr:FAD-dependent oxidoreductase [Sphaerochaetaceae bacterium]MDD4259970.1 FAD-dependent oxidoreductase [Sphaerochaetaceae bacterium]MDD4763807.1 FAD-dependent oxidoreductase [Sphaerochaetaceae bacterium]MDD4841408.1 FAD-dependent oxidoreductase [Sphaerochaetaceae bacterium]NLO60787.1 FAD-dependent oxidoreductase [Spirochaetales bacterium]
MVQIRTADRIGTHDVIVCGGGPAGIVAALAAARNGADTAIIEQYGFFGGTASGCLVNPISKFKKNGTQVVGGIAWEFVENMAKHGGALLDYPNGNVPFDPEIYKWVAQKMLGDAHVHMYLHSTAVDCEMDGHGAIKTLVIHSKAGFRTLNAGCFVDATGDALLARLTNIPMQEYDVSSLQPASLCFIIDGIEPQLPEPVHPRLDDTRYYNKRLHDLLEHLKSEGGEVPNFGGPWFCSIVSGTALSVNITRGAIDPFDIESLTKGECDLRNDMHRLVELLKANSPEFRHSRIVQSGIQAGIRESQRIRGVHVLTGEEYVKGKAFFDTIALGAHPVDIHRSRDAGQDVQFLNTCGKVPYRSLVSAECSNLIVAGRCISADRYASASIRVQATAMATGEAAGTSASLCVAHNKAVHDVDVRQLQMVLKHRKAILEM